MKYDIAKDNIEINKLIKISNSEFSKIMEIMEETNIASLTEKFDDSVKIIELYNNLIGELSEIENADQYQESINWLKNISEVIINHIDNFENNQDDNIKILEESIKSLRKFYDLFKAGELATPIYNISEFHDLLNKSGFDLPTKVEIKKVIGQSNYNLIYDKKEISKEEKIEKIINETITTKESSKHNTTIENSAKNAIEEANKIILKEEKYLEKETKIEEYFNFNNISEESEHTLTIIIKSIKDNKDLLNNLVKEYIEEPKLYEKKIKELILNLNEYIETYKIIKNRLMKGE